MMLHLVLAKTQQWSKEIFNTEVSVFTYVSLYR